MAAGVRKWLQEPRCGCRSQDVAEVALMWLQEPRCGFQVLVWLLEQCSVVEGTGSEQAYGSNRQLQGPKYGSVG